MRLTASGHDDDLLLARLFLYDWYPCWASIGNGTAPPLLVVVTIYVIINKLMVAITVNEHDFWYHPSSSSSCANLVC